MVLTLSLTSAAFADWVVLTSDDFESGWGSYTDGGGDCRRSSSDAAYAHQGTYCIRIRDNSGTSSSMYYTNGVDVDGPGYTQIKVDFWFMADDMESGEDFWVQYYDGSTWQTVADFDSGDEFVNGQFYHISDVIIDEGPYNFPTDMQIRFMCDASSNSDEIYIDEVVVSGWEAGPPDTDPPTPDPMTWASVPAATGHTSISMTASTATDASGVEYYFECTAGGGNDSGWQDGTTYEDTGLSASTQYTYGVQARDESSNQNATAWSTEESATTDAPPPAYLQDSGADGIVSMESENFDLNVSQGGFDWTSVTSPASYSGTGAMQALPNSGTNNNTGYVDNSPRLDFEVDFVKTGTHYVWLRSNANGSGSDDSAHAGLNNQANTSSDRFDLSNDAGWVWTKDTMDGVPAEFDVPSTGVHTVNIWMREDGARIDKIVLTTSASYTPTGMGPDESPRGGGPETDPPTHRQRCQWAGRVLLR
jgi:hypothetical protein